MKNNFLKAIFFIVFFLIFGVNAKASTAKCTYGDDRFGIEINIDSEFNITYKKVGTNINYVNISSFVLDLGDFKKSSNELFCPSQIKYKITSHSRSADYDMIINTNDASYNFSIKLDDNKSVVVNNSGNNNSGNNNVNLVRSCTYSNYIVNVYSDGSIKASRANYTVTVEDPDKKFLNGCPDQVYVSDSNGRGGNYASIYTYSTPSGTVTKLNGNNGNNNNNNSGSNNTNNTNNNGSNGNENCHSIVSKNFHDFLQKVLDFIKYLGPTLVAIFTIIDLIKAALSGDAGEMKKMSQKLIKRLIAALLLFFIPLIVNLIFDLVGITGPYVCSDFK